jgi:hypothetical protein
MRWYIAIEEPWRVRGAPLRQERRWGESFCGRDERYEKRCVAMVRRFEAYMKVRKVKMNRPATE